ncbi:hypothetical protein PQC55_gp150 [Escherichia phage vB_EcoP-CHD5UKE1]|uniref:Uncharacterized protein n=1 Tax=Escherichia phage vB_EcoP-CHD5UKE1 TaxID=2865805 RepID=A0ABX9ALS1_9CAUD|nr:hypothetical protein PQC55_gp150 [Escherichia phage vB_EcoP-CHD5UKE1]QZI80608.1 hypothetical protein CHD5UKE1_112 [Escherichia phage vB_EcoP-CHD5UKE1]
MRKKWLSSPCRYYTNQHASYRLCLFLSSPIASH